MFRRGRRLIRCEDEGECVRANLPIKVKGISIGLRAPHLSRRERFSTAAESTERTYGVSKYMDLIHPIRNFRAKSSSWQSMVFV